MGAAIQRGFRGVPDGVGEQGDQHPDDAPPVGEHERQVGSGISWGYLSPIMNGEAHPSPEVRERLQRELGIADFDGLFSVE